MDPGVDAGHFPSLRRRKHLDRDGQKRQPMKEKKEKPVVMKKGGSVGNRNAPPANKRGWARAKKSITVKGGLEPGANRWKTGSGTSLLK